MDVDEHSHCKVCGKVCPPAADTCSAPCREKREAAIRSRRTWTNILYILVVVFAFLLVIELFH